MATITSIPSDKTLSMNKNSTSGSTTISWTSPTIPNDATITSCVHGYNNLRCYRQLRVGTEIG